MTFIFAGLIVLPIIAIYRITAGRSRCASPR
jgi:hypothetical protein